MCYPNPFKLKADTTQEILDKLIADQPFILAYIAASRRAWITVQNCPCKYRYGPRSETHIPTTTPQYTLKLSQQVMKHITTQFSSNDCTWYIDNCTSFDIILNHDIAFT